MNHFSQCPVPRYLRRIDTQGDSKTADLQSTPKVNLTLQFSRVRNNGARFVQQRFSISGGSYVDSIAVELAHTQSLLQITNTSRECRLGDICFGCCAGEIAVLVKA